jgi:general stress protein 26
MMNRRFDSLPEEVRRRFKEVFPEPNKFIYFPMVFLATSEGDQPRVRPVGLGYFDEKFWIVTGTNNAKTEQIRKNPKVEFCLLLEEGKNLGYVRGAGLAQIIQDRETKIKIGKRSEWFSEFYKSPDDPNYTLINLCPTEIEYLKTGETTAGPAQKFIL